MLITYGYFYAYSLILYLSQGTPKHALSTSTKPCLKFTGNWLFPLVDLYFPVPVYSNYIPRNVILSLQKSMYQLFFLYSKCCNNKLSVYIIVAWGLAYGSIQTLLKKSLVQESGSKHKALESDTSTKNRSRSSSWIVREQPHFPIPLG